jgi:hypothetical protein
MHLEQTNSSIASKMNSRLLTFCKYSTEKSLGLAFNNPGMVHFFEFANEQLALEENQENQWHFWIPAVASYPIMPRCHPNLTIIFPIVASIVYGNMEM